MSASWVNPRAGMLATVLFLLTIAGTPNSVFSQSVEDADSALTDLSREIDKQLEGLEDGASEELGTRGEGENEELWEEYQRYRDRSDEEGHRRSAERVEIGGSIVVREDEHIEGDVVAVGGGIEVLGSVGGDVVAIGGNVMLRDGATVHGDAVSVGGKVREEGTATVHGERVSVDLGFPFESFNFSLGMPNGPSRAMSFGFNLAWLLVGLIIAGLFYVIAGRRLDVVSRRIDAEPGQSFLIGLLAAFGTPLGFLITVVLLAVTVIGILLIPILVIVVFLMITGGFYAVALAVGRRIAQARGRDDSLQPSRGPFFQIVVGYLALYALSLASGLFGAIGGFLEPFAVLLGVLSVFVVSFASILGYGALITSRFGTSPGGEVPPPLAPYSLGPGAVPPPPPPPPPAPTAPTAAPDFEPESRPSTGSATGEESPQT